MPSRLEIALPFVVAGAIQIATVGGAAIVRMRVEGFYNSLADKAREDAGEDYREFDHQETRSVAAIADWAIDAVASLTILTSPFLAVVILVGDRLHLWAIVAYATVAVVTLLGFVMILRLEDLREWSGHFLWGWVSPVALAGIALNIIFGAVAVVSLDTETKERPKPPAGSESARPSTRADVPAPTMGGQAVDAELSRSTAGGSASTT